MEPILNAPVILDIGKTSRKNIRQLKQGRGKLLLDVQDALQEMTKSLGDQANGKQLVPVVLLYRKKARKGRGGGFLPVF